MTSRQENPGTGLGGLDEVSGGDLMQLGAGEGPAPGLAAFLASAVDSKHTRRAYQRHILEAFRIMANTSLAQLHPNHLVNYRQVLIDDGRGAATHAQALSALRSYLTWCADMGGLPFPLRMAERVLRVPSATVIRPYVTGTRGEVDRLLEITVSLRDQALILVMLGSGLRVSEVEGLDCSDVVTVDGEPVLHVRKGKGNKDRLVPITDEVLTAIHHYLALEFRVVGGPGPLFLAEDRGVEARDTPRLSHYGIRLILNQAVLQAGIAKRITPHALRHTFGMEFQRASSDLSKTAKVMGHATLVTTMRYTDHLQLAELRTSLPRWIRTHRDG
jgi:integrase/recombinase XerC